MQAFVWIGHTLEAGFLLALLVVLFGVFCLLRWIARRPVSSQSDREAMFLAHHVALAHARRVVMRVRDAA